LGVEIKPVFLEQAAQQKVKELEEKYAKLDGDITALNDHLAVLDQKKEFLKAIGAKTTESISDKLAIQRPSVAEWGQMLKFMGQSLDSINQEYRQTSEEKMKLDNQKNIISYQLSTAKGSRPRQEKSALIDLAVHKGGMLTLAVTYTINGAAWTPLYDIRVNSDTKEAELTYMAMISQSTGEDWNDVKLTLSTARPVAMASLPGLATWGLDVKKPQEGYSGMDMLLSQPAIQHRLSAQEVNRVQAETSIVSNIGISATFQIIQKATVASDNTPQKVTINVIKLKGEMDHYAIPKRSENVYLKAKVKNDSEMPLLAGKTNIFFDGDFISASAITSVVPSESFELFLGIDQGMKIKRELVTKFTDETGFSNSKERAAYEYKITAENLRKTEEKLTILDQYPVSRNEDIEVNLKSVVPPINSLPGDQEKGFLRWTFNLKPTEKKEMQFKYEIKYPKATPIEGLQ